MILYKYCDPGGIKIIESGLIKIKPVTDFNDIHEFKFQIDKNHFNANFKKRWSRELKFRKYVAKIFRSHYGIDKKIDSLSIIERINDDIDSYLESEFSRFSIKIPEMMLDKMTRDSLVLCLSKNENNQLMWAHYCSSYSGFVLGINVNKVDLLKPSNAHKVIYSENPPIIKLPYLLNQKDRVSFNFIKNKNIIWEYEKEVRYVFNRNGYHPDSVKIDGVDYLKIGIDAIDSVKFSPKSNSEIVKKAEEILGKSKVIVMNTDINSYGLY